MAMFDWNNEELTNIIWGEAKDSDDDLIVPNPVHNEENHPVLSGDPTKKEMNHESEQKKPCTNTEHGVEVVGSCRYGIHDPSKGLSNPWRDGSDIAITHLQRVDQDSMCTTASNNVITTKDATGKIDKVFDFLQNPPDDRDQGDFVDYGWANIGSFDDLERIFRNNDPICGVVNGGSVEEPWFSSQGVTSCTSILMPPTSGDSSDIPLCALNSLDRFDMGAECTLDSRHSFVSVKETFREKSLTGQDEQTFEIGEKSKACQKKPGRGKAATMNELSEKRLLKEDEYQKSEENNGIRQLHALHYACSTRASPSEQFSIHYEPSMVNQYPPLVLSQQWQSSTLHGNMFHYPIMSILPQFHPVEGNHETFDANSPKKSVDVAVRPPTMTPEEKIGKLRRRQQLRALLAIQKQKQQFGNHLSVEHSIMDEDSSTVSIPSDNLSVEESVLYQLQEIISNLDIQIRLSIRDSLFRLAQSAIQRQCPSDTGSINSRDEVVKDIDTHERISTIYVEETDTNPIDRTVAHLLFHRPLEFSGKHSKKHDSPVSAYLSQERKPRTLHSLAKGQFSDTFEKAHVKSPDGSKTLGVYFAKDHSKNSSDLDTLLNISNSDDVES